MSALRPSSEIVGVIFDLGASSNKAGNGFAPAAATEAAAEETREKRREALCKKLDLDTSLLRVETAVASSLMTFKSL
jgi:hypothetical protein